MLCFCRAVLFFDITRTHTLHHTHVTTVDWYAPRISITCGSKDRGVCVLTDWLTYMLTNAHSYILVHRARRPTQSPSSMAIRRNKWVLGMHTLLHYCMTANACIIALLITPLQMHALLHYSSPHSRAPHTPPSLLMGSCDQQAALKLVCVYWITV